MDAATLEIPIPPGLLDSVYPEVRCRPEAIESTPAELIAFAIDAAEIRGELGATAELPAVAEDIRTVCCPDCDGTGNGAPATRDPQDQRHWDCEACGGTAEVRACGYCGEIVGSASECAACKEEEKSCR